MVPFVPVPRKHNLRNPGCFMFCANSLLCHMESTFEGTCMSIKDKYVGCIRFPRTNEMRQQRGAGDKETLRPFISTIHFDNRYADPKVLKPTSLSVKLGSSWICIDCGGVARKAQVQSWLLKQPGHRSAPGRATPTLSVARAAGGRLAPLQHLNRLFLC